MKGEELTGKSILNLLSDRKKLEGQVEYTERKKLAEDGLGEQDGAYWYCTCRVQLKGTDTSERIIGSGSDIRKKTAMALAADAAVTQLKGTSAALRDELICETLNIAFEGSSAPLPGGTEE